MNLEIDTVQTYVRHAMGQMVEVAERLGDDVGSEALAATRDFLERFTARGRTPADKLRELLDEDPAEALAWAASDGGSS